MSACDGRFSFASTASVSSAFSSLDLRLASLASVLALARARAFALLIFICPTGYRLLEDLIVLRDGARLPSSS